MPPRSPLPVRAGERGPRRIGLGLAALGRPGYLNLGHGADLGTDRSVDALRTRSFAVLDAAYAAHPDRFVRKPPVPLPLPKEVWINKPQNSHDNPH